MSHGIFTQPHGTKRILGKIGILLLFLFCADRIAGLALRQLFDLQQSGALYDTKYLLEQASPEVVVFGDSRATHHYNSGVMKEQTGSTFYNAGRAGMGIFFSAALQEVLLNRHLPKCILLELNPTNLYEDRSDYDRLSVLLPFHRNHPELGPFLSLRGRWETTKLLSHAYPFNSLGLNLIAGALQEQGDGELAGYVPLHGRMGEKAVAAAPENRHVGSSTHDPVELEYLQHFIEAAQNRGIDLIFVISPVFVGEPERLALQDLASHLPSDVQIWNHLEDADFKGHPELFYDRKHLNEEGAKRYSKIIAAKIQAVLRARESREAHTTKTTN